MFLREYFPKEYFEKHYFLQVQFVIATGTFIEYNLDLYINTQEEFEMIIVQELPDLFINTGEYLEDLAIQVAHDLEDSIIALETSDDVTVKTLLELEVDFP